MELETAPEIDLPMTADEVAASMRQAATENVAGPVSAAERPPLTLLLESLLFVAA